MLADSFLPKFPAPSPYLPLSGSQAKQNCACLNLRFLIPVGRHSPSSDYSMHIKAFPAHLWRVPGAEAQIGVKYESVAF